MKKTLTSTQETGKKIAYSVVYLVEQAAMFLRGNEDDDSLKFYTCKQSTLSIYNDLLSIPGAMAQMSAAIGRKPLEYTFFIDRLLILGGGEEAVDLIKFTGRKPKLIGVNEMIAESNIDSTVSFPIAYQKKDYDYNYTTTYSYSTKLPEYTIRPGVQPFLDWLMENEEESNFSYRGFDSYLVKMIGSPEFHRLAYLVLKEKIQKNLEFPNTILTMKIPESDYASALQCLLQPIRDRNKAIGFIQEAAIAG